jgi:cobaltochelatase CobN
MRTAASAALLLILLAAPAAAQPVRLAYLYSDSNIPITLAAYRALLQERPDLRGRVSLTLLTESTFDDVKPEQLSTADVLVFDVMNEQMLARFGEKHRVDLLAAFRTHGKVLAVGEGLLPREHYLERGAIWNDRARGFWAHSGFANQLGLMKLALAQAGITGLVIPEPQPSLEFGFYYPDGKSGRVFASWDDFDAWRSAAGKAGRGRPRVAIGFFKSTFYSGDTALLDAMIAELERRGAEAVPIFGYPGAIAAQLLLLQADGRARVDAMLGAFFNFGDPESSKLLAQVDVPIVNVISLYGRSEKEWRASNTGMTLFEGTFQVAVPELAGTIAPTIVGSKEKVRDPDTGLTAVVTRPIASRVVTAVQRVLRYAALRSTPNAQKRVALLYYNYPPGKANIGASYLNVAGSLSNVLQRLSAEGYMVGDGDLSPARILGDITTKARNVGGYAPGELEEMLAAGGAALVTGQEYNAWLDAFAPSLRRKILHDWGPPAKSSLMTTPGAAGPNFVIPAVRYGNVVLLPQPARGWGEDAEKMYHAKDLAPHHQYVATYAWLRYGFGADAVVHVGTHGTLEWLDGKDAGLSEDDAPDALIGDLPDIYIYNVDVVGEGLVARRRGMAALVDHMVPPFTAGGLYAELAALSETINDHVMAEARSRELAAAHAADIARQAAKLGLDKDLELDLSQGIDDQGIHAIQDHLIALKGQNIPYGLHTFGRTPDKPLRDSTVAAIVGADRSMLPGNAAVLADEIDARIVASGPRELESLIRALAGRYLVGGTGGEPIRNPDAYPTGKNFYGIDPDKVPKAAAWDLGVRLADQMLADHVKKTGRYPEKVSFVIWGDETMRHEGVLESQIFHLLGTKPVWDPRGKVVDVEVVPAAVLRRPRVDIVIASAAEGMFHNVTVLMDRAVQKAKALDEADNFVRAHYLETKAQLIKRGYREPDADRRAGVRIFDEPPGQFNLNTSTIVAASGTWNSTTGFTDDYIDKLGHGYGNGFWGEPMSDVFKLALSGTEKVVHSSSTMLYGALDNDDMFMYVGGLAAAVRSLDGKSPDVVVTNTRDPGRPEMTSIGKFIGTEFRSRYVNPTWIEGMKKEGYAGAGAMKEFVEYLWGWEATVPETVTEGMWQETFDVYVQDKHGLGMKDFFETRSPFAYQDITARMLETVRKGSWSPGAATRSTLVREYVASVNAHGVSGSGNTTGNVRLTQYVLSQAGAAGVPVPAIDGFQQMVERAMGGAVRSRAREISAFITRNEGPRAPGAHTTNHQSSSSAPVPLRAPSAAGPLSGFVMEQRVEPASSPQHRPAPQALDGPRSALWIGVPILILLVTWRMRRRNAQ